MPVDLHKLNLSVEKMKALPALDRYAFALAGHIFNELMLLQKMVTICQAEDESHPLAKDGGVMSSLFMVRTLAAKLHEAMDALTRPAVSAHLRAQYFQRVPGLEAKWDAVIAQLKATKWVNTIRNRWAFHYMKPSQWGPFLTDDALEGAYAIVGQRYGDTLFWWAEVRAAMPMLSEVNAEDPFAGLATILETLGDLVGHVTDCLACGIQAYMVDVLTDDDALDAAEPIEAPELSSFRVPYFFVP